MFGKAAAIWCSKLEKGKMQNRQGKKNTLRTQISGTRCHSGHLSIWFLRNLFHLACSLLFLWLKVKKPMYTMKKFLPPREIQFKIDRFFNTRGKKGVILSSIKD